MLFYYHTQILSMFAEEQQKLKPVQLPISKLKKEIHDEIINLIQLLKNNYFKEKSIEKGWINEIDEEKGQLRLFLREIDPSKIHVFMTINKEISKQPRSEYTDKILAVMGRITGKISTLPDLMIEEKIKEYFHNLNIGEILDIKDNQDGVQLKRVVTIRSFNHNALNFYVKTHSRGLLRSPNKSTSKPVDPIELITYKILEHSGYGTQSHFFYDDIKNFYIATKDVAVYADQKQVKKYSQFLTSNKEKLDFPRKIEIKGNEKTYGPPLTEEQSIIDGLMTADIISRIFCLTDLLTHDGNIVFIKEKEKWKLKIIDFRNNIQQGYPEGSKLFNGLVSGHGQFFYVGNMDKVISHYLGKKNLQERIQFARNFDYNVLRVAVEKGQEEMSNYMNLTENRDLFQTSQEKVFEYCDAIKNTISQFEKSALSW